jgi:hypothetical protein
MEIFLYKNNKLVLNVPEILLIPEFEVINNKPKSIDYFKYIFLMINWRSPYKDYEQEIRHRESLKSSNLKSEDITTDVLVCMGKYKEIIDSNSVISLLRGMTASVHKFEKYFDNIDFTTKVESGARKGTMLYDPMEYLNVMKRAKDIFDSIKQLSKTLEEELQQKDHSVRGADNDIGYFNEKRK